MQSGQWQSGGHYGWRRSARRKAQRQCSFQGLSLPKSGDFSDAGACGQHRFDRLSPISLSKPFAGAATILGTRIPEPRPLPCYRSRQYLFIPWRNPLPRRNRKWRTIEHPNQFVDVGDLKAEARIAALLTQAGRPPIVRIGNDVGFDELKKSPADSCRLFLRPLGGTEPQPAFFIPTLA